MRKGRFFKGRSNNKGGFSGQRGGRNRRQNRQRRNPRQSAESGNQRERIAVESGYLVLIDQFMLANPQFMEKLLTIIDAEPELKDNLVRDFGGSVVQLEPGTYRIERDPYAYSIVIHSEDDEVDPKDAIETAKETHGHVFIDTRCLAMIDRELLDDNSLLERYQQLWFNGQDKACRDLLRDNGGAVRYGFQRYGDELGIYMPPGEQIVCLWPDIAEAPQE